ncbi:MAG: hypothetical protein RLY93_03900 [Sumerlaeia bacterium]
MTPEMSEQLRKLRETLLKLPRVRTRQERLRDSSPSAIRADVAKFDELADKAREAYFARGGKPLSAEEIQAMLES